jgi:hypothetical protein
MRRSSRLFLALALGVCGLGFAQPADAQVGPEPAPPTLAGETFFTSNLAVTAECNESGTSTIRFVAQGVATGPYPGTFRETGTFTIGEQTLPGQNLSGLLGLRTGPVVDFQASFSIDSAVGDVHGTKAFLEVPVTDTNPRSGTCASTTDATEYANRRCRSASPDYGDAQSVTLHQALTLATYEATIDTQGGAYRDTGTASASLELLELVCAELLGTDTAGQRGFAEFFHSGLTQPVPLGAAAVFVTPKTAVNPVGTQHTVTATAVNTLGAAVQGETIRFVIAGSVNEERSCVTDQEGRCSITYTGPTFPGVDTITACADSDDDNARDPGEPCDVATKEWVLPVSTPGKTTGGGQILHVDGTGTTFGFTFSANDVVNGLKGQCNVLDHGPAAAKVDCLDVLAYVQTANEVTVYGNATVSGEDHGLFRLHVVDNGESGMLEDEFDFQTEHGYVRAGLVTRGDVQVHPSSSTP